MLCSILSIVFFELFFNHWNPPAIITINLKIAGGFQWLRKSSKKAIDNIEHNILGPIYDELSKLNHNMQVSNEQYERAQKRLEDGDKKFI